jgi:hypothetical protein
MPVTPGWRQLRDQAGDFLNPTLALRGQQHNDTDGSRVKKPSFLAPAKKWRYTLQHQ